MNENLLKNSEYRIQNSEWRKLSQAFPVRGGACEYNQVATAASISRSRTTCTVKVRETVAHALGVQRSHSCERVRDSHRGVGTSANTARKSACATMQ